MNPKNKKWIASVVCGVMLSSSLIPGAIGFAREIKEKFEYIPKFLLEGVQVPKENMAQLAEDSNIKEEVSSLIQVPSEKEVIHKRIKKIVETHTVGNVTFQTLDDEYSLSQEEMEHYLQNGSSLEDIYYADELANQLSISPAEILTRKKSEKEMNWGDFTKLLVQEKDDRLLKQELTSFPELAEHFDKSEFDTKAKRVMILGYKKNVFPSIEELIQSFTKLGIDKFITYCDEKNTMIPVSEELMSHFKQLSEETGKSVETLKDEYIQFKKQIKVKWKETAGKL